MIAWDVSEFNLSSGLIRTPQRAHVHVYGLGMAGQIDRWPSCDALILPTSVAGGACQPEMIYRDARKRPANVQP